MITGDSALHSQREWDRNMEMTFGRKKVVFYLDGVNFAFKTNPLDQAKTLSGRIQ